MSFSLEELQDALRRAHDTSAGPELTLYIICLSMIEMSHLIVT